MKAPLHLALSFAILALPCTRIFADPSPLPAPGSAAAAMLKEALYAEETGQDREAAVKLYLAIVSEASAQRSVAAVAAFRLGEVARKQGRMEAAQRFYSLAQDWKLAGQAAEVCRAHLQSLGGPLTTDQLYAPGQPWQSGPIPQSGMIIASENMIGTPNGGPRFDVGTTIRPIPAAKPTERLLKLQQQLAANPKAVFTPKDLVDASIAGDLGAITFLLDHGVDVNAGVKGEEPALYRAIARGHHPVVRLLAERGAALTYRWTRGEGALHHLAWNRDVPMAQLLISKGMSVNDMAEGLQETRGVWLPVGTPLHVLGMRGSAPFAEMLIAAGADVNAACPESGHTPLHTAARFNQATTAQVLLRHGAKVDVRYAGTNLRGRTPMHEAAEWGSAETGILLANAGASLNTPLTPEQPLTPVHLAVRAGHMEFLRGIVSRTLMIDGGFKLPEAPNYKAKDEQGDTALHIAARKGSKTSVAFIVWLIQQGAPLDAKNNAGLTPTELAASPAGRQDPDISAAFRAPRPMAEAPVLSDAGRVEMRKITQALPSADAAARSAMLHQRCQEGELAMATLLLDAGLSVESPGEKKRTPLATAASHGRTQIVSLLLDRGAAVNAADEDGRTALHFAAKDNHAEAARLLIARGAVVNANAAGAIDDRKSWPAIGTPLTVAARGGFLGLCQLLIEHGADVNFSPPTSGQTPLITAARNGRTDVVSLLLAAGGNVHANCGRHTGNETGSTALHNAAWFGHGEIMVELLKAGAEINHRKIAGTDQFTPFMLLIRQNFFELAHRLCTPVGGKPAPCTPDLTVKDAEGNTALHVAVRSYSSASPEFIAWLIARGAPLDAKNNTGLTPGALAADAKLGRPTPEILSLFKTEGPAAPAAQPAADDRR